MGRVIAEPEHVQLHYRGAFSRPAFSVFGQPTGLYANLFEGLKPVGATLSGLSVNVAVLAETNVSCSITGGTVRVWLDHVEVWLNDVRSRTHAETVLRLTLQAIEGTAGELVPVRHFIRLACWSKLRDEIFSRYISRFIAVPTDAKLGKPSIQFTDRSGDTVHLAEAATIPEGLFFRSEVGLAPTGLGFEDLTSAFWNRVREQMSAFDLEIAFKD